DTGDNHFASLRIETWHTESQASSHFGMACQSLLDGLGSYFPARNVNLVPGTASQVNLPVRDFPKVAASKDAIPQCWRGFRPVSFANCIARHHQATIIVDGDLYPAQRRSHKRRLLAWLT